MSTVVVSIGNQRIGEVDERVARMIRRLVKIAGQIGMTNKVQVRFDCAGKTVKCSVQNEYGDDEPIT